ncbi:diguanylate cyclase/phosphodiesterase (GGDEF & EAL domains) with PAS/PAC sensor(s) [hydrothermal vent metagenome]|uniref:histidine kinase n=1 Tax=hydrothermal vent metagenome TaxID=652676 RepID=A0A3B0ZW78_9ZZZZ
MKVTLTTERLIIAWGIIFSIFVAVITFKNEIEKDNVYFESSAGKVFNKIELALANVNRINREFNSLFYLLDEVREDEFRLLAGSLLRQNEFIEFIYFSEKVLAKDKLAYEKEMREDGYTGFVITQFHGDLFKKSEETEYLFPIKYIEPFNVKNSRWFGHDLLTLLVAQNAIASVSGNLKSLAFLPATGEENRLFAVQVLFNDYDDNLENKGLSDAFGILLYKINIRNIVADNKFFDFLWVSLDDKLISPRSNSMDAVTFGVYFEVSKTIYYGNQKLEIKAARRKNLFSFDLLMSLTVLLSGLFLTLFIWHIIRAHIEHNQFLAEQKKIIEEEVNAKTNELASAYNQQLALSEELEAFSYSVSHDLRAPLRSLNGFARAIEEDYGKQFDATAKDYLQRICKASQRMGTLIDALLSLSRLTRKDLLLEHFSISDMARMIVSNLQGEFPQREVEVIIDDGLAITADKSLMYVVLDNLIRNAWKYTKNESKARIKIGMEIQDGDKVFFVNDNGVGFDMAYSERLFGSFQRLHHQRDFEGDGIGLATAKRVIVKHNAKIWAQAEVDKGATFYFTLPPLEK